MPSTQPVLVHQEPTAGHPGLLIRLAGDRYRLFTCDGSQLTPAQHDSSARPLQLCQYAQDMQAVHYDR